MGNSRGRSLRQQPALTGQQLGGTGHHPSSSHWQSSCLDRTLHALQCRPERPQTPQQRHPQPGTHLASTHAARHRRLRCGTGTSGRGEPHQPWLPHHKLLHQSPVRHRTLIPSRRQHTCLSPRTIQPSPHHTTPTSSCRRRRTHSMPCLPSRHLLDSPACRANMANAEAGVNGPPLLCTRTHVACNPRMPPAQRDQRPIDHQHTGRQQHSSHVHPPPGPAKAHAARRSAAQHPQSATQPVAHIWRWLAQPDSSNMGTLCTQPRPLAQPGTLKHTQDHATAPQNEQQQAGSTHKQPLQLTCPAAPRRTAADRPERR